MESRISAIFENLLWWCLARSVRAKIEKKQNQLVRAGIEKKLGYFFFHAIFFSPNSQIQTLKSKVPDPKCKI